MTVDLLPLMTHELGRYWEQPRRCDILIDDTHAVVSPRDFNRLKEYSSTLPSGVYVGKAWRARHSGRWWLRWYGAHPTDPDLCTNNERELLVTTPDGLVAP